MSTLFVGKSSDRIQYAKRHKHDDWEIVIPVYGEGFVETDHEKVPFRVGTAYVMPPNMEHTTYSDSCFTDIYIQTDSIDLSTESIISISHDRGLPELAELIFDCYMNRNYGFRGTMEAALSLIVQLIRDHCHQTGEETLPYRIRTYLVKHMENSELDMSVLTEEFGYCSDHIRRIFKQTFDCTPMSYLNAFRLSHAKKLLRNMPFYSVADICRLCGYGDKFYFSRQFKEKTGLTPSQYRAHDS